MEHFTQPRARINGRPLRATILRTQSNILTLLIPFNDYYNYFLILLILCDFKPCTPVPLISLSPHIHTLPLQPPIPIKHTHTHTHQYITLSIHLHLQMFITTSCLVWFKVSGFCYHINIGSSSELFLVILLLPRFMAILQLWDSRTGTSTYLNYSR